MQITQTRKAAEFEEELTLLSCMESESDAVTHNFGVVSLWEDVNVVCVLVHDIIVLQAGTIFVKPNYGINQIWANELS